MVAIQERHDPHTGTPYRILTGGEHPCRKLYYTCESWLPDDRRILYRRAGPDWTDLCLVDEQSGEEERLFSSRDGWSVRSFGLDRHLNKGCIQKEDRLYLWMGEGGEAREWSRVPGRGAPLGHLTFSQSGMIANVYQHWRKYYVLAITDLQGTTRIVYETDTRLGHCQFCPGDDRTVFFCHETGGDALQRMWIYDLEEERVKPFFVEKKEDWITHEVWGADGETLSFVDIQQERERGGLWIGARDGQHFQKLASGYFHHVAPDRSGRFYAADRLREGEIVLLDTEAGTERVLLTNQPTSNGPDHPHPSFNRAGDRICFTAPGEGVPQVGVLRV